MRIRRVAVSLAAVTLVFGLAAIAACSKSDKNKNTTTGPPAGAELNSPDMLQNGTFSHPFGTSGAFAYHCIHHSFMHGTVNVSDAEPAGDKAVTIHGLAYDPPSITVHTGNVVTWTNQDGTAHTVTSD